MSEVKKLFRSIASFLAPILKLFASKSGKILARAAMVAVTEVAATMGDADGEAKRKAALKAITAQLKAEGVELATSTINLALEAAVAKLKDLEK